MSGDPARSRPGRLRRAHAWLACTRPARTVSRRVGWRLDPVLLRVTGGRLSFALVVPTGVLETVGARTGARRRNAVIAVRDGDDVVVVASKAGAPEHPAWFHNLRAHPDVVFAGRPVRAFVVDDEAERARLWAEADRVFPGFARYRRDAVAAGRTIPLVRLTPRREPPG